MASAKLQQVAVRQHHAAERFSQNRVYVVDDFFHFFFVFKNDFVIFRGIQESAQHRTPHQ